MTQEERKEFIKKFCGMTHVINGEHGQIIYNHLNEKHIAEEVFEFIEQKKKEWQEEAYEKGKEDADFLNNQFNRP